MEVCSIIFYGIDKEEKGCSSIEGQLNGRFNSIEDAKKEAEEYMLEGYFEDSIEVQVMNVNTGELWETQYIHILWEKKTPVLNPALIGLHG